MKIKMKLVIIIVIITLTIFASLLFFKEDNVVININGQEIHLNADKETENIDLKMFSAENDFVKKVSGNAIVKINGNKIGKKQAVNIGTIAISEDSKINIVVRFSVFKTKEFTVNTLPSTFPKYSVEGKSSYEGDYYMSTFTFEYADTHYIFKISKSGNMLYYKELDMVSFDFKKVLNSKNEIRYTYLEAVDDNYYGIESILPCELVILNDRYEEIDRVKYLLNNGKYEYLDNHTYVYLDDNHYILTSYQINEKVTGKIKKLAYDCVIQEVHNNKVLWEFNSDDYPKLYEYSTENGEDYIHINSIEIDKDDGNIICSFRNIDSVIKLNRKNGKIMWILGGVGDEFKLSEKQKFFKQHSAISIGNNTFLIYDNGNANKKSRVVKVVLDEKNKKITEYTEYDTEIYSPMMGSVRVIDKKKQIYLICYGGIIPATNQGKNKYSVEEIDYKTNLVKFKFTFIDDIKIYNANKIE